VNGYHGFIFELGSEASATSVVFSGSQGILGVSSQDYQIYQLILDSEQSILSDIFLNDVNNLPQEYNEDVYFQFILSWGTHYSTSGNYGGKAKLFTAISQAMWGSSTTSDLSHNLGIQFDNWRAGFQWGNDDTQTSFSFSSESFQWINFIGGDASYAFTDNWESWVNSTRLFPAQVKSTLNPISELVSDPVIRQNIDSAISKYLNSVNVEYETVKSLDIMFNYHNPNSYSGLNDLAYTFEDFCLLIEGGNSYELPQNYKTCQVYSPNFFFSWIDSSSPFKNPTINDSSYTCPTGFYIGYMGTIQAQDCPLVSSCSEEYFLGGEPMCYKPGYSISN